MNNRFNSGEAWKVNQRKEWQIRRPDGTIMNPCFYGTAEEAQANAALYGTGYYVTSLRLIVCATEGCQHSFFEVPDRDDPLHCLDCANELLQARCLSCRYQDLLDRGISLTNQQRNHYMLWGCTCEPGSEAAALDFMKRVTE